MSIIMHDIHFFLSDMLQKWIFHTNHGRIYSESCIMQFLF